MPLTTGLQPATWPDGTYGIAYAGWTESRPYSLVEIQSGDQPVLPTTVRVARTPGELLVLFSCTATTIRASMAAYKDKVWQEDAVEVYLRPPGSEVLYEFQLSPIGTYRDLRVIDPAGPNQYFDDSWSCDGARTDAVILRDAERTICGWKAIFGFPWSPMGDQPFTADGWSIGLFRIERDPLEYSSVIAHSQSALEMHDPAFLAPLSNPIPNADGPRP